MNVLDFLLNRTDTDAHTVQAPAFALTKVLDVAAVIVAPLATLIVDKTSNVDLTAGQYVTLALGLLAFLAITSSADVLARSIAAAGKHKAEALVAGSGRLIPFKAPLPGRRITDGSSNHVDVLVLAAARGDGALFLVKEGDAPPEWAKAADIKIP